MTNDDTKRPGGIESIEGEAALTESAREQLAMERGDAPDPLDGLLVRITAEGRTELALDRLVIDALLDLEEMDGPAFGEQVRLLRRVGVLSKDLDPALKRRRKQRADAAKAADQARTREEAQRRRAQLEEAQREAAAADAALRAEEEATDPVRAMHRGSFTNAAGHRYSVEPGEMRMRVPKKGDDYETTELANFSCVIVAHLLDFDVPDAKPRMAFLLSVILGAEGQPFEVEVAARDFARMEWVELLIRGAAVAPGKLARDHLRHAIQKFSRPVDRRRYRFTGWVEHDDRWVYVHAGGAIDADGVVEGVCASPADPVHRFCLPAPPEGEDLHHDAFALVELLSIEPAEVMVPLVGITMRAGLGPSRCTVHVTGVMGKGKSYVAGLCQQCYGASMSYEAPPTSFADGSSANGICRVWARAGDCVVMGDDLRVSGGPKDIKVMDIYDQAVRAHFNRAAPRKLTREGGERNDPVSRCSPITTGEVLPQGHSTRARVVSVMLNVRPSPDLEDFSRRATEGQLASAMAAFLRWYAPQVAATRPNLPALERAAAKAWKLGLTDRAAGLFGALALGLDFLFRFLIETGTQTADEVDAHRARAETALRAVAIEHGERVAEEDPVARFVDLFRSLIASGRCHLTTTSGTAPTDCHLFGWRASSATPAGAATATGEATGPGFTPQHDRVGYVSLRDQRVWIIPETAYRLVRDMARSTGDSFGLTREDLGKRLFEKGLLAETEMDTRRTYTVRKRVSGRLVGGLLCFPLSMVLPQEDLPLVSDVSAEGAEVSDDADTENVNPFE